jgi:transcriptional regulator with XRE-family HTH domain
MLPLLLTPGDAKKLLATRLRAARRARRWTQAELAARAGLSVATVARLERAGEGQLASFLQLLTALGRLADLDDVLAAGPPAGMDAPVERPARKGGAL